MRAHYIPLRTIAYLYTACLCALFSALSLDVSAQTSGPVSSGTATTLLRMTPADEASENPSEIIFQFDKPVVPLGRMDRSAKEIAITFTPPLACEWRWQNPTALACVLGESARPRLATKYTATVPAQFDTTTTVSLGSPFTGTFTSPRPSIAAAWVKTWSGPGMPAIELSSNQSVTQTSLASHLYFEDQLKQRHPVVAVEATPEASDSEAPEESTSATGQQWIIAPQLALPGDIALELKIAPGLTGTQGPETGREERGLVSLHTFADFQFVGITCRDLQDNPFLIATGQKASTRRCDPLNAIQLTFSAPIKKEQIAPSLRSQPDLRGGRTDFDPWESTPSYSQLNGEHTQNQQYFLNLPYGLKANTNYTFSAQASDIRDEFGRSLSKDLSVSFTTDNRAPRFVLDNRHSVLEKETDSKLPVIVNNIDTLAVRYQALTTTALKNNLAATVSPFKASNVAYAFPIDIRGLLGGRSGVIQGTVSGKPPQKYENTQRFFTQVTPYAVHAKVGHFNSLVWVTALSTGERISDASVSIFTDTITNLSADPKIVASATTDQHGVATLPGTASLDPKLDYVDQWDETKPRLFIRVEKNDEMALVPLSWDYQVYDNDIYPYSRPKHGHIHTWGTTAQGVYRLGDKVQFAIWVRDQNNERLIAAPSEGYSLEVKDPTDKVIFQVPSITLSEFGSYAGEFTTGTAAAVGWYTFTLKANFSQESWEPLRVLISDFTPAPFAVTNEIQGALFRASDRVTVRTEARLHAGGPYADAPARMTARLVSSSLTPKDPALKDFVFSVPSGDHLINQREERLDAKGDLVSVFDLTGSDLAHGELLVESAVQDDRGKFVTSLAKARYVGRTRFVGIAQGDWILSSGKTSVVKALVIDENGQRIQGEKIRLQVEYEDTKVARVKSAGNVYTNRYENTWVAIQTCDLTSGIEPTLCEFTPTKPGRYRCTATVQDSSKREHTSSIERWGTGSGDLVWQTGTNNQLQIIPERDTYKIGETARFMIQNPCPAAHALLTVERYGVQRSWNQTITEPSAIIEVPVTNDHLPGFFFSATLMSPRVAKPIEGNVDLGKPSFRMGYARITVDDPVKQLGVTVSTPKASYKPREQVTVDLALSSNTPQPADVEFAVTVIDEAVFDLISSRRGYFDPYRGFYSLDGLDVKNYNLIKMLLGRQLFEKKGANPGGDGGGKLDMRSVQKYVTYWNPAIHADANGRASISFEAPDNLTGWKVFALAFTKEDRMGLGEGRFVVNKDTEVRSALPNQVRRGDTFSAVFTVMNRTDKPRTLSIETSSEGDSVTTVPQKLSIVAEPFKRYPVTVSATAIKDGVAHLMLKAFDASDGDALRVSLPILPKTAPQTAASFGSSQGTAVEQPIQVPADIDPQQGSIGAVLSASLLGGLDGAFTYMRDYPYECWEQKLSKAVMAAYSIELRRYLPQSFSWPNAKDLVLQTLTTASQHQAPNGGMAFYTPTDEYTSHFLSAFTALAFTWLGDLGYTIPSDVRDNLGRYLDGMLRNDTFDASWSGGEKATARALVLAALARNTATTAQKSGLAISASDIQRLSAKLPEMGIFGKALYLQATSSLGATAKSAKDDATKRLLSAGSESNATYSLKEPQQRLSPWLLDSNMRSQCIALDALITANGTAAPAAKKLLEPRLEKLARTIMLDRKRKDRWENTQENLFCVRALATYAKHYEQVNSNSSVEVSVGTQKLATLTMKQGSSEPVEVSRPLTSTDAGSVTKVTLSPTGTGRFYYSTRLSYALREPKSEATNAGIEVTREFAVQRNGAWAALTSPMQIQRGELVTVNLFVRIASPRYFVVISDPVPGGLEPVNRDLATSSTVDSEQRGFSGPATSLWFTSPKWISFASSRWSFYHRELRHASARFYSEYLEPGNYHLSYVAQAIAPGHFVVPPTHAETMYDPDIFGESTSGILKIE